MKPTKKVVKWLFSNKLLGGGLVGAVLLLGGYGIFLISANTGEEIIFVTETVKKGELISSLSGNGQVSASDEVEVKFKTSGDVVYVGVANGQEVKKGTLIAQLDTGDAKKTIRDAEINLESAQLSLEKLLEPADELEIMQAENNLAQAQETKNNAENDLEEIYEDALNTLSDVFLNLPTVITGLQDILFSDDLSGNNQWNLSYYNDSLSFYNEKSEEMSDLVYDLYLVAKSTYDNNLENYKSINRYSRKEEIENLVLQTYSTTKDISDAIKSMNNLIQLYQEEYSERNLTPKSLSNTHLNSLSNYTGLINGTLSDLLSTKNSIKNKKEDIVNAIRSIEEKTETLLRLKEGVDEYDLRSANISIFQKENALLDAKESLSNYFLYAPFTGTISGLNIRKGGSLTSSSAIGTLITNQKIAEIVLNEIEIADVEVGQKVNLKFDAVDDLVLVGEVAEIDTIGTVNSGVVNYGVKINFDSPDGIIKPGMSVNAEIIIESKENILIVSNSAITYVNDKAFVQISENGLSKRQAVIVGMSTDLKTEIMSGLSEGMEVIIGQNSSGEISVGSKSGGNVNNGSSGNMEMMRMMR